MVSHVRTIGAKQLVPQGARRNRRSDLIGQVCEGNTRHSVRANEAVTACPYLTGLIYRCYEERAPALKRCHLVEGIYLV